MITDMQTRTEIAEWIQRYLFDVCDTLECQDAILGLADATKDETAKDLAWELYWCFEDECYHQVILKKETWDGIQRMLLVLASGGHIQALKAPATSNNADAMSPFFSKIEIRTALRRAPHFHKQPYRRDLEQRHIYPWPLEVNITPKWLTRFMQHLRPSKLRHRVIFPNSNDTALMV